MCSLASRIELAKVQCEAVPLSELQPLARKLPEFRLNAWGCNNPNPWTAWRAVPESWSHLHIHSHSNTTWGPCLLHPTAVHLRLLLLGRSWATLNALGCWSQHWPHVPKAWLGYWLEPTCWAHPHHPQGLAYQISSSLERSWKIPLIPQGPPSHRRSPDPSQSYFQPQWMQA